MERRRNIANREEFEVLAQDLARRLGRACAHMKPSELIEMARSMTRLRIKYDAVTAVPWI